MERSGHNVNAAPAEVVWRPQGHHPLLPLQVLERSELLNRIVGRQLAERERAQFHQLLVCTGGVATHIVDLEPLELRRGVIQRIHPGQVQQYVPEPAVQARMVIWPWESHSADPGADPWYPGSGVTTRWMVDDEKLSQLLAWVEELAVQQERFDGSTRRIALLRSLLRTLLLRIAIELPTGSVQNSPLPDAYLSFRMVIERHLGERPTVTSLARLTGYSTRTIDRACGEVSGQTAKQVLDERVALEVRRRLTHSTRPIAQVASSLGFDDPSNFSKFVKRQLGQAPSELRDGAFPHGV